MRPTEEVGRMPLEPRYAALVQRLRESVLGRAGETDAALRTRVAARATLPAAAAGTGADGIPEALCTYVDRVAHGAYRVTDADVEALKRAGYSEDVIFEITVSAAVGAGVHRLERGLSALRGEV